MWQGMVIKHVYDMACNGFLRGGGDIFQLYFALCSILNIKITEGSTLSLYFSEAKFFSGQFFPVVFQQILYILPIQLQ